MNNLFLVGKAMVCCYVILFSLQDILFVRLNLSLLNGPIAKMTALVSVIFAELTILGKCCSDIEPGASTPHLP